MGLKGFAEGGVASIIAGASTHPLDLIKVRMQLQGESHIPNLSSVQSYRPAFTLSSTANISLPPTLELPPPPRVGPLSIGVRIIQSEGAAALFSGVSATILRQTYTPPPVWAFMMSSNINGQIQILIHATCT